jgi:NAD+ diphosphatase
VIAENRNVFAGAFVDRSGERRKDDDWLAAALDSDDSRFVPVWRKRCLVAGDPPGIALLTRRQLDRPVDEHELIFLGIFKDHPTFAFSVDGETPAYDKRGDFQELRYLGTVLPPDEANLAAHARALVGWHASQVYCGRCGSAARPAAAGNARQCVNEDCGNQVFPRVDPAIIVLVHDDDRCLLGRQASWPEGRYSTIAGFVEPGESLEDAVRREVYEETNVRVGRVSYHSSQPWPFPSALMLGFVAEATSTGIKLNDGELEDARWFTREELLAGACKLPFSISIARRLVDHWLGLAGRS